MEDEKVPDSTNWTTAVEDLVDAGDIDGAISLLESLLSKLETQNPSSTHLELASVLTDLANLYSSKGFSLKADDALSRASLIRLRSSQHSPLSLSDLETAKRESKREDGMLPQNDGVAYTSSAHDGGLVDGETTSAPDNALQAPSNGSSEDDWEAIAERAPDDLVIQCLPEVSKLSLEDTKIETPKRRGRGTFSYKKYDLYSDRLSNGPIAPSGDETVHHDPESNAESGHSKYGTRHVLVLADFPPSTKTIDLEKLFENFRDRGVSIRWVNDTVAFAVFRTPSIAHEAYNLVHCPFTVHILDEDDSLISSIPARDLDPPRPRPQTSARTAKRLIAQGMGLKLPSTNFGSQELKKQEEARRNRIIARKILKDDAWGDGLSN